MSSSTWSTPMRRLERTGAQLFQANVQKMGFDLELTSVDYATIESTVLRRLPSRGATALYRWMGLVARLQRPLESALAELH